MNMKRDPDDKATLVISHMSNKFGDLPNKIRESGFFEDVIDFDEKNEDFFPELKKYREEGGNFIKNLRQRIKFTSLMAKLEAPYVPVDFKKYKDIYVFCDSDPIGYYLNKNRIRYHAVEDGLNCLKHGDLAHYDNRKHFWIKSVMSQKFNLIFIQNGFGKYCIDMEVNDISQIEIPFEKYVEVSRKKLVEGLTKDNKSLLLCVFVDDIERLRELIESDSEKTALILTEPLCTLDVRETIFKDIIAMYEGEYNVILKPHPRDELDYNKLFPNISIIAKTVPMEMLNFFEGYSIDVVVGVFTELSGVEIAKEKVRLAGEFMDKYEDPLKHSQDKILRKEFSMK